MYIPLNFSLEEILKVANLPEEIVTALENAWEAKEQEFKELQKLEEAQDKRIERLEEVQSNAENLIYELERELKVKDFRYTETKNLVNKLTELVENCNIEV